MLRLHGPGRLVRVGLGEIRPAGPGPRCLHAACRQSRHPGPGRPVPARGGESLVHRAAWGGSPFQMEAATGRPCSRWQGLPDVVLHSLRQAFPFGLTKQLMRTPRGLHLNSALPVRNPEATWVLGRLPWLTKYEARARRSGPALARKGTKCRSRGCVILLGTLGAVRGDSRAVARAALAWDDSPRPARIAQEGSRGLGRRS